MYVYYKKNMYITKYTFCKKRYFGFSIFFKSPLFKIASSFVFHTHSAMQTD